MNIRVCLYILCFYVLFSCNGKSHKSKEESIKKIEIDFNKTNEISINDIYKSIKIIPLEKTKECLIGGISKLIPWEQKFYVLDKMSQSIFIFDNTGHFLNKIDKRGNGSGEYYSIDDFEFNPFTNNIEILSAYGFIYEFDMSGNFIKKYNIPLKGRAVHYLKDISKDVVALYSISEDKHIILYNKKLKSFTLRTFSIPQKIENTPLQLGATPFDRYDGKVIFFQGFSNNVYELGETGIKVKYLIDFGQYNVDLNSLPETKDLNKLVDYMLKSDKVNGYVRILENSKYIYAIILKGKSIYHILYNKSNQSYFAFEKFKNKIIPNVIDAFYQDGAISFVYPQYIPKYITPEVLDDKNRKILETIKVDDNPVLIYYEFKN